MSTSPSTQDKTTGGAGIHALPTAEQDAASPRKSLLGDFEARLTPVADAELPDLALTSPGQDLLCAAEDLPAVAVWLAENRGLTYATLVMEEHRGDRFGRHVLYGAGVDPVSLIVRAEKTSGSLPSLAPHVHAADWHEREAAELFGGTFEGHPRLGDFVIHPPLPSGEHPLREGFNALAPPARTEDAATWAPPRLLEADGAFLMSIGPIFSDYAESARFALETVGEDVRRTIPRLFFKHRGVERTAVGRTAEDAVLLAERFSGTSAFAHSLAFCQAVEAISGQEVPPRAQGLRVALAELERIRHHVASIASLCGSTALGVPTNLIHALEEELLRLSGRLAGHRYLFGLNVPGGLSRDVSDADLREALDGANGACSRLARLGRKLTRTSSFLDRLEQVGVIREDQARHYGLVGPVARGAGVAVDLRRALPYAAYVQLPPVVPAEQEGDGYARLRVLLSEVEASRALLAALVPSLPEGAVRAPRVAPSAGAALGWVEAPAGAAFHFLRTDEQGRIARLRIAPPSFANWHGFHLAAEHFAFQDFPIIMASMALSIAESDR